MLIDYHLIVEQSEEMLDVVVKARAKFGWDLHGFPFANPVTGYYCQAMKKLQPHTTTSLMEALEQEEQRQDA